MNREPSTLPVAELFGRTFQGEGPSTGRIAAFLRLGGCNLTCSGCDSGYTWDATRYDLRAELTQRTVDDILAALPTAPLTVVTGGEPLLYQRRAVFADLLTRLSERGDVEIETNGTLAPSPQLAAMSWVRFNVSPKLDGPMSADPADRRINPTALRQFAQLARHDRANLKFVVRTAGDVHTALQVADTAGVPRQRVWLMPEGTTPDTTLTHARAVADTALTAGVNLTLRQHVLLWPTTERGR